MKNYEGPENYVYIFWKNHLGTKLHIQEGKYKYLKKKNTKIILKLTF